VRGDATELNVGLSVGKPEGNIHLKDLEVDARRFIKWISNK
jgi:hypothetical protein